MADGEVVIKVNLDEQGFDAGSGKMISAIQGITQAVDRLSGNLEKGFTSSMQSINNADLSKGAKNVESASNAASSAINNMATTTRADLNELSRSYEAASSDAVFDRATTSAKGLEKSIQSVMNQTNALTRATTKGFKNSEQVLNFSDKVDKTANRVGQLKIELDKLHTAGVPTDSFLQVEQTIQRLRSDIDKLVQQEKALTQEGMKYSSVYRTAQEALNKALSSPQSEQNKIEIVALNHELNRLTESGLKYSDAWLDVEEKIKSADTTLDRYMKKQQDLVVSGKAFSEGIDDSTYERLNGQLDRTKDKLMQHRDGINAEAIAQARLNVLTAQQALAAAKTPIAIAKARAELERAQENLNKLTTPSDGKVSKWEKFKNVLSALGSKAKSAMAAIGKLSLNVLAKGAHAASAGLKKLASGMHHTKKRSSRLVKTLTSLKTLLVTRIKRMFISAVIDNVGDALKALALYDNGFNQAMSNIQNSAKQLAGNLAVTLGGIIKQVEPIITAILNMLNDLAVKINSVSAFINGQDTVTVAKRSTESYADSLDEVQSSANKAEKAQKKLKAVLSSYDELHLLDGADDTAADNPLESLQDTFETVPVKKMFEEMPDYAEYLFNNIRDAIKDKKWKKLGEALAFGLNALLVKTDYAVQEFAKKGEKWSESVADVMNGLTEGTDATLIGKTLADSLNTALRILDAFLYKYDFSKLGKKFAEGINSFTKFTDWQIVGQTIGDGLNAIVDYTWEVANGLDWTNVGVSLGTALNTLGEKINFKKLGESIGMLFSGLVDTINGFVTTTDWALIGKNLADTLNGLGDKISLQKLGETLGSTIAGLNTTLNNAINNINWHNLGVEFGNLMNGLGDKLSLEDLVGTVCDLLGGALQSLAGFFETFDWGAAGENLAAAIKRLITGISGEDIGHVISDLLSGALDFFSGLLEKWKAEDFTITGALKTFIGDAISAISWSELGEKFVQGLKDGINWAFREVKELFSFGKKKKNSGLSEETQKALEETSADLAEVSKEHLGKNISEGLVAGVDEGLDKNKDLKKAFGKVTTTAEDEYDINSPSKVFEGIGDFLMKGLKNGIEAAKTIVTTAITLVTDAVKNVVISAWNKLSDDTKSKWSKIFTNVSDGIKQVKSDMTTFGNTIDSGLSDVFNKIKTNSENLANTLNSSSLAGVGTQMVSTIHNGINAHWTEEVINPLKWWVSSTYTNLWNYTDFTQLGRYMVEGFKNGIDAAFPSVTEEWSNKITSLIDTTRSLLKIGSPSKVFDEIGAFTTEGFANGLSKNENAAVRTMQRIVSKVSQAADAGIEPNVNGLESISFAEDTAIMKISRITSKLSDVALAFLKVGEAISGIGNIQVPKIVAGEVVPERIKADVMTSRKQDDNTQKLLLQIIDLLHPRDEEPNGDVKRIEIPVRMNEREIGRAIADMNVRSGRITNGGVVR